MILVRFRTETYTFLPGNLQERRNFSDVILTWGRSNLVDLNFSDSDPNLVRIGSESYTNRIRFLQEKKIYFILFRPFILFSYPFLISFWCPFSDDFLIRFWSDFLTLFWSVAGIWTLALWSLQNSSPLLSPPPPLKFVINDDGEMSYIYFPNFMNFLSSFSDKFS